MSKQRRKFTAEIKPRVALDALSGEHALSELASKYGVHLNQVSQWKQQYNEHRPHEALVNLTLSEFLVVNSPEVSTFEWHKGGEVYTTSLTFC